MFFEIKLGVSARTRRYDIRAQMRTNNVSTVKVLRIIRL